MDVLDALAAFAAGAFDWPGTWGFFGALVYSAQQLGAVLFGELSENRKRVRLAWWQFAVCNFFGTVATAAFGPTVAAHFPDVAPIGLYLVTGLSINGAWPAIERAIVPGVLRLIGARVSGLAAGLGPGDQEQKP